MARGAGMNRDDRLSLLVTMLALLVFIIAMSYAALYILRIVETLTMQYL
jgi:hypothetical protein